MAGICTSDVLRRLAKFGFALTLLLNRLAALLGLLRRSGVLRRLHVLQHLPLAARQRDTAHCAPVAIGFARLLDDAVRTHGGEDVLGEKDGRLPQVATSSRMRDEGALLLGKPLQQAAN